VQSGKYLEELIKHWNTVCEQTLAVEKAIANAEEAECHLTCPGAAASLKDKVVQLKQLDLSLQDIYLKVADYYHQHPVLQHIPKAKVSTGMWIEDEEWCVSLLALCEEWELWKAGQSISTSSGLATYEYDFPEEDLVPYLSLLEC
jgi:hypothetical protein